MFSEDGQGFCCPSYRAKLIPLLGFQDREELGTGLSRSFPPIEVGGPKDQRWQDGVLRLGCRV
jgi:hypothetical protein